MVFADWLAVSEGNYDRWAYVVLLSVPRGPDPVIHDLSVFTAHLACAVT